MTLLSRFIALSSLLLAAFGLIGHNAILAQTYAGQASATVAGKSTLLERQSSTYQMKARALGLAGVRASMRVEGGASPTRFAIGTPITFSIKLPSHASETDPAEIVKLIKLEKKKDYRFTNYMSTASMWDATPDDKSKKSMIGIEFISNRNGILVFKPTKTLESGEYAVMLVGSQTLNLFGID